VVLLILETSESVEDILGKEKAGGSSPPVGPILFQCEAADDKVEWTFFATKLSPPPTTRRRIR
jgi:hypothetical protein